MLYASKQSHIIRGAYLQADIVLDAPIATVLEGGASNKALQSARLVSTSRNPPHY